eukprot:m51a1_g8880 hypothetical protein (158) ;mRNA; f:636024-636497
MPQLRKGGKHVYGWSAVSPAGAVVLPPGALREYGIAPGDRVLLLSGSRSSRGFRVSTGPLLAGTVFERQLALCPEVPAGTAPEGVAVRATRTLVCCWAAVGPDGSVRLSPQTLAAFGCRAGGRLLAIRGSNVAFVMAAQGPLVRVAEVYEGTLRTFE